MKDVGVFDDIYIKHTTLAINTKLQQLVISIQVKTKGDLYVQTHDDDDDDDDDDCFYIALFSALKQTHCACM